MRQTVTAAALLLLDGQIPPVDWDRTISAMSSADRAELARELRDSAMLAARVARYVSTRANDASHALAVRDCNTTVIQLAFHLGYTYPQKQRINF